MQLKFMSVMVSDQERALDFYTNILGFNIMADIPMGAFRWLTVTSPDGIEGVELVLEPIGFKPAKEYQLALFKAGIPAIALISNDIEKDYESLKSKGVKFLSEPKQMGMIKAATFDDSCGNIINLVQPIT
jgi:predicted enzyme related to lactoylglutathione lyase